MFFATGLIWLLAWSGWWTLLLAARMAGLGGMEPARPAMLLHGAMMLFLVLPPFMYGFLLTVFPRWMTMPPLPRKAIMLAFTLLNAGNLLFLAGLAGLPLGAETGWLLATLALGLVCWILLAGLWHAPARVSHGFAALAGLLPGLAGMLLFLGMLLSGDWGAWPLMRGLGLWGFLLVVYFAVSHRMIPFFTARIVPGYVAWRPDWLLYLFIALGLARAVLEMSPAHAWLASAPLAAIGVCCVLRWRPRQRHEARLLSVLHLSLLWLAAGLLLAAAADIATALGMPGIIGRAPIHALGMGFFGSMLMAMVTRVSLGHSGRALVLAPFDWGLFLLLQVATLLRVAGEFLAGAAGWLALLAAVAWLAAFATWAARYLLVYFRPRLDGAPG